MSDLKDKGKRLRKMTEFETLTQNQHHLYIKTLDMETKEIKKCMI